MVFPEWLIYVLILICSYLIGSFPTGWILGKALKKIDIRNYGSGNTGFSNVYRILGGGPAVISIIVDVIIKGHLLVWIVRVIVEYTVIKEFPIKIYIMGYEDPIAQTIVVTAGLMAVIGHNWPIWLKFKGGKGFATTAGIFVCYAPISAAILAIIWFTIVFTTRYTSLANIITIPTLPIFIFLEAYFIMDLKWINSLPLVLGSLLAAILVIFTHRENIRRLRKRTERKFGDRTERINKNID